MTLEVFKRKSSLFIRDEPQNTWLSADDGQEAGSAKPLPNEYIRLVDHSGKWRILATLKPYTEIWVKKQKGRLWRHIREMGIPSHFVTLTYADEHLGDRKAEELFSWAYNRFMTRLRRYLKSKGISSPEYVRVLDYGSEHGRLHYHLAFWNLPYISNRIFSEMWEIGYTRIEKPNAIKALEVSFPMLRYYDPKQIALLLEFDESMQYHVSGLVGYLLKYIVKNPGDVDKRPKGVRAISYSRGLKPLPSPFKAARPEVMDQAFRYMTTLKYDGRVRNPLRHSTGQFYDPVENEFVEVEEGSIQEYGYFDQYEFSLDAEPNWTPPWCHIADFSEEFIAVDDRDHEALDPLAQTLLKRYLRAKPNTAFSWHADKYLNSYLRKKLSLTPNFWDKFITAWSDGISLDHWL